MATSSIRKNFIISGESQVRRFVEALETSSKDSPIHTSVSVKEIHGETELRDFMRKRKQNVYR